MKLFATAAMLPLALWAWPVVSGPLPTPSHKSSSCQQNGTWTNLPPIADGACQEQGTALLDGIIYMAGGIPPNSTNEGGLVPSLPRVRRFSIPDNAWLSDAAPMPRGLTHTNAIAVKDRIYVLGGLTGKGSPAQNYTWYAVGDCFVYDPHTDAWETLPSMSENEKRGASALSVVHDRYVLVAGGMRSLDLVAGGLQDSVDLVSVYDTVTGVWSTSSLPNLPAPRDHVGGALLADQNTFFVVGGRNNSVRADTTWKMQLPSDDALIKGDGQGLTWESMTKMPTPRGGLSIGLIHRNGRPTIVTFGGEGNPAPDSNGVFNNTEAYDIMGDRWSELAPMPKPRHGTIAVTEDDKIYIPGGGISIGAGPVAWFDNFHFA